MPDRADLATRTELDRVLQAFYTEAFADPLPGPVFLDVAGMDLRAHLPIFGAFWEKVLFNTGCYDRQPMRIHRALHQREPLTPAHFARWLSIWDRPSTSTTAGRSLIGPSGTPPGSRSRCNAT